MSLPTPASKASRPGPTKCESVLNDEALLTILVRVLSPECLQSIASWFFLCLCKLTMCGSLSPICVGPMLVKRLRHSVVSLVDLSLSFSCRFRLCVVRLFPRGLRMYSARRYHSLSLSIYLWMPPYSQLTFSTCLCSFSLRMFFDVRNTLTRMCGSSPLVSNSHTQARAHTHIPHILYVRHRIFTHTHILSY